MNQKEVVLEHQRAIGLWESRKSVAVARLISCAVDGFGGYERIQGKVKSGGANPP
jgi:hypothetical protein